MIVSLYGVLASPVSQWVKNLPTMQKTQETQVWSLGWEDPLKEEMATHSNILAQKILWFSGGPLSTESQSLTQLSNWTCMGENKLITQWHLLSNVTM